MPCLVLPGLRSCSCTDTNERREPKCKRHEADERAARESVGKASNSRSLEESASEKSRHRGMCGNDGRSSTAKASNSLQESAGKQRERTLGNQCCERRQAKRAKVRLGKQQSMPARERKGREHNTYSVLLVVGVQASKEREISGTSTHPHCQARQLSC